MLLLLGDCITRVARPVHLTNFAEPPRKSAIEENCDSLCSGKIEHSLEES